MATYLILNLVFIVIVCVLVGISPSRPKKALLITFALLLILTVVFDNLIIIMSIVAYDTSKILGIYLGMAPVEDFMYAMLAVLLVPVVWRRLESRHV